MRCHECDHGFECCHRPSVRHAGGVTECLGDEPCDLAHDLHVWVVDCEELGCPCGLPAAEQPGLLPLAA